MNFYVVHYNMHAMFVTVAPEMDEEQINESELHRKIFCHMQ